MRLPNKARQRENAFLRQVYDLMRQYQKGDVPDTSITVGPLDAKLTWLGDQILLARKDTLPPDEKRNLG